MSEGQFYKVMEEELRALKVACQRFENYNPTITFVVVLGFGRTSLTLLVITMILLRL